MVVGGIYRCQWLMTNHLVSQNLGPLIIAIKKGILLPHKLQKAILNSRWFPLRGTKQLPSTRIFDWRRQTAEANASVSAPLRINGRMLVRRSTWPANVRSNSGQTGHPTAVVCWFGVRASTVRRRHWIQRLWLHSAKPTPRGHPAYVQRLILFIVVIMLFAQVNVYKKETIFSSHFTLKLNINIKNNLNLWSIIEVDKPISIF